MKYLFNFVTKEIMKELTKKVHKRISLSTKIIYFSVMIFPITFILSLVFSADWMPNCLNFLSNVFCFVPLSFAIYSLVKADSLRKREIYTEKLVSKSFSNFLESIGITDEILIEVLKKRFYRKYVHEVLKTGAIFYNYKDIRTFCLDARSYGYGLYVDISCFVEKMNNSNFNKTTQTYEKKSLTPYEKAMKYFSLVKGFSKEELKKAYRRKLKEVHPDSGGTQEEFLKAQGLFEILNH